MVNEDVFGGLAAAMARKQPLGRAMTSLLNAGYDKGEIREAAMLLRSQGGRFLSGEVSAEKDGGKKKKKNPSKPPSKVKWKSEKFKLFPEKRKFRGGGRKGAFKSKGIGRNGASFKIPTEKRPAFRKIRDDRDGLPEERMRRIPGGRENFSRMESQAVMKNFAAREKRERERMTKIREQIILEYGKNGAGNPAPRL